MRFSSPSAALTAAHSAGARAPRAPQRHWAVAVRIAVGLLVAAVCSFLFARVLSALENQTALIRADLRVSALVQTFRTPALTKAMVFITDLGRWQGIVVGGIALSLGLALWRRKADIAAIAIALLFGTATIVLIKTHVHRARPEPGNALTFESSFSFPSGHTFVATVFYGLAAFVLFRAARGRAERSAIFLGGLVLVLLVGFSRIYLGVHWPSDVLASFAAGTVWLAVTITPLTLLDRDPDGHGALFTPNIRRLLLVLIGVAWFAALDVLATSIPLPQPHAVAIVVPVIPENDVPKRLFETLPKASEDISGRPMEPVNIVIIGFEDQVRAAFEAAGWQVADPLSLHSFRLELRAMLRKEPYPEQPGTPSFWNGRPNLLAFEKSTPANVVRERHHIHLWNAGVNSDAGRPIWVATAHFDKGFKRASALVPVHAIDPDIDLQREYVRRDLEATGRVESIVRLPVTGRLAGRNFAGDRFFTDGTACLLVLEPAPAPAVTP